MKTYPKIIDRILDGIRQSRTICVVGHVRPDGDCVGSQLGLALALKAEGKKVACWNEDSMPQKYAFLDSNGLFQKPKPGHKFDCVIATDCASFERLGRAGLGNGARVVRAAPRSTSPAIRAFPHRIQDPARLLIVTAPEERLPLCRQAIDFVRRPLSIGDHGRGRRRLRRARSATRPPRASAAYGPCPAGA